MPGWRVGSNTSATRGVEREARALAYQLDPGSILRRGRRAVADRRVTLRPAPDTMTLLTGFLPVAQGVAAYAALTRDADQLKQHGDPRSRGQLMADLMVARLTGQEPATGVPVEVQVVMSDRALLGDDHDRRAHLVGGGPIPAGLARDLVADAAQVWVRRLYTSPVDGTLVAMDSRRRVFDGKLRQFLVTRDQTCRTAVVRRPDPARRPHHRSRRPRHHQRGQRPGTLRGLQLHQSPARLDRTHRTRRTTARGDHHHPHPPHRAQPRTRPAGLETTPSRLEAAFTNLLLTA